jgi:hypothetical protein
MCCKDHEISKLQERLKSAEDSLAYALSIGILAAEHAVELYSGVSNTLTDAEHNKLDSIVLALETMQNMSESCHE